VSDTEDPAQRRSAGPVLRPAADGSLMPVPDPTTLTTEAVDRATAQWHRELAAQREILETRLDAMDRATLLRLEMINGAPAKTQEEVRHLRELLEQRADLSDRAVRLAADESRVSLTAALDAAKEAVKEQNTANSLAIGKSEIATQKQIDALALLMTSTNGALSDKIDEVKSRLDRGEGVTSGASAAVTDQRGNVGQNLAVLGAIVGVLVLLMSAAALIVSLKAS